MIITRREEDAKKASLNLNREKNELKREEIWKTDILRNFILQIIKLIGIVIGIIREINQRILRSI